MKCVLVDSTPSSVESFSETNAGDLLKARPVDEDEKVVGPRHQVAGLDLVKAA